MGSPPFTEQPHHEGFHFPVHHAPLVHAAPAPYAPAPYAPPVHHVVHEKIPPKPFAYEYGGADAYGRHFAKTETQDDHGVVQGKKILTTCVLDYSRILTLNKTPQENTALSFLTVGCRL